MLAFYTVLNSSRSFWQHSSDSIFVLATFEDLAATKQLSEFIHGSLKFLCRLVYWIKKIVMKDIFHSKSCDLKVLFIDIGVIETCSDIIITSISMKTT